MLKEGDVIYRRIDTKIISVRNVQRLTKTLAILDNGTRLKNKPIRNVGNHYYYEHGADYLDRNYYSKETPALKEQLRRQVALSEIKKVTWEDLPTKTLIQILEQIKNR